MKQTPLNKLPIRNWIHKDKEYRLPGDGQLRRANVILGIALIGLLAVLFLVAYVRL